ncbi:MAG: hypothetical protein QW379_10295 [Thermoplasmata archaeon]
MAGELLVGLVILAAAVVTAWLLARAGLRGARKMAVGCPHCGGRVRAGARVCPECSREIVMCRVCGAYILDGEGRCELCGESLKKSEPPTCLCPRCGASVESGSRKCRRCGEEFWSPVVAHR